TTINVAVPRVFNTKDQECDWYTVEYWGKTAELVGEHFKKGSRIGVTGRMCIDEYTKDGEKKFKPYVNGNEFTYIDVKNKALDESASSKPASKKQDDLDTIFASEDEIPF